MTIDLDRMYRGTVSERTLEVYTKEWGRYVEWAGGEDQALRPSKFAAYREYLVNDTEFARATINTILSAILSISAYLYASGIIDGDIRDGFRRTKVLRKNMLPGRGKLVTRTRIEPAEMRAICNAPDATPDNPRAVFTRALVLVLATSGLRISEAARLKLSDIEVREGGPIITGVLVKGGGRRDVPLSPEAHEAVKEWEFIRPVASEYIFNGFRVDPDGVLLWADYHAQRGFLAKCVREAAALAGVPNVKSHDLRRFVGTSLAKVDIRLAQLVLGHANIQTTLRSYVLDRIPPGITNDLIPK